jgi:3-oxoacyl-[acyl-carrier-protein] synthase III
MADGDATRWMLTEDARTWAAKHDTPPARARFESIGLRLPETRRTTQELMASTRHRTHVDLERLTGIHERRIAGPGEDSFSLAVDAARDCLAHSRHDASDIEMLVNTSISRSHGDATLRIEPPLSLFVKEAIGATDAVSFDLSNACAGMTTGVLLLDNFIRRGEIERGMVVSGEYISHLATNAAAVMHTIASRQLASLTVGDAGAAVIVERAPEGCPGISVAAFTTLCEHSRLCLAYPSRTSRGGNMFTKARALQRAAMEDASPLVREALASAGLHASDIDWFIPHQTSARAIRKGARQFEQHGVLPPHNIVCNVEHFGNTSSNSHFVALYRYLEEERFRDGDRIMLVALASGIVVGAIIFTMDELRERYGSGDRSRGHRDLGGLTETAGRAPAG